MEVKKLKIPKVTELIIQRAETEPKILIKKDI